MRGNPTNEAYVLSLGLRKSRLSRKAGTCTPPHCSTVTNLGLQTGRHCVCDDTGMRLICGIVHLDGKRAGEPLLQGMIRALGGRNPSPALATRVEGAAAMCVLDFAAGHAESCLLPEGADDRWLAADVRLDRPDELARSLALPVGTSIDSLVLAATERWDRDVPDRMHGDFALAAWDGRQRRLLFALVFVGTRPLCYTHQPGRFFAFASLPRGLHGPGVASAELDLEALGMGLLRDFLPPGRTHFRDIHWLPAGHSLAVTPDRLDLYRAWRPDPGRVGSARISAEEAAEALRTMMDEAVACRLSGSGPIAAHLSGGLDSSAVAAIAARKLRAEGRKLHAWSQLANPKAGTWQDEREFVELLLNQEPDIAWHPAYMDVGDQLSFFDPDLPVGGWAAEAEDRICQGAAKVGAGLLLSGAGGDEGATYNGEGLYAAMLRAGRWRHLPQELRLRARVDKQRLHRTVLERTILPLLPKWLQQGTQWRGGRSHGKRFPRRMPFLNPALAARVQEQLPPQFVNQNRAGDRIRMFTDSYLVARADRWSIYGARHGVAFTYPLLDRRIVDFTLSLPLDRFVDGGYARQPFRNAMHGVLPEAIRWRTSKFVPFPELPVLLARGVTDLLQRLETLRSSAVASELINFDAAAHALREAELHAGDDFVGLSALGQGGSTPWFFPAHNASRMIALAEYATHFERPSAAESTPRPGTLG